MPPEKHSYFYLLQCALLNTLYSTKASSEKEKQKKGDADTNNLYKIIIISLLKKGNADTNNLYKIIIISLLKTKSDETKLHRK